MALFYAFLFEDEHHPIHVYANNTVCMSGFTLFFEGGKLIDIQFQKVDDYELLSEKHQKEAMKMIKSYTKEIELTWPDFFSC